MTGRLHEAEHELIQTKTELQNTMKQFIETRDECSTCEEQNESLKLQVTSIENELSQSRRQNSKLQGELSIAMMGIENLKHERNRRQLQHMSMQVNGSSAHGANEYMNITPFATSYDYNHGRTCTTAGSMINNLADPSQRVSNISCVQGNIDFAPIRPLSCHGDPVSTASRTTYDEPKFRLPYFNGKGDFQSFWTIFKIGVKKFSWNGDKQIEQLLCSLKDDALTFATKLPEAVQSDINALYSALNQRYGDHLLPEQYRENLNQVRKLPTESLSEYACRVGDLVNKAYPMLNPLELVITLTIEHILRGLPDQTLAYEVRTKSPKTIDETIRLVTWHECCKNGSKRQVNIRYVEEPDMEVLESEPDVRTVSNSQRFVTEAKMAEMNKQIVQNLTGEINKLSANLQRKLESSANNSRYNKESKRSNYSEVTCYNCHEKGHISKWCPNKDKSVSTDSNRNSRGAQNGTTEKVNAPQSSSKSRNQALN